MRHLYNWLNQRLFQGRTLSYKLNIIFFLFFFGPVVGLIYFGIHYHLLTDRYLPLFFMGLLALSFFGLNLLRKIFDEIKDFSQNLAIRLNHNFPENAGRHSSPDELQHLIQSLSLMDQQLESVRSHLERKSELFHIIRDMADMCYVTADPDEILHVALERALALSGATVGSILLLAEPDRDCFVVKATIGLQDRLKVNDHIDFETSIAKYAVLNKTALIVDDIEKDSRFGRINRSHYSTHAFACLPIKASREIIGVLTLSQKEGQVNPPFLKEKIQALEPLLSNAAFTYENLILEKENSTRMKYLKTIGNILEIINSSFRGSEMLQACMNEIRSILAYDIALILMRDPHRDKDLVLMELVTAENSGLIKGSHHPVAESSCLDRALQQQATIVLADAACLSEQSHLELRGKGRSGAVIVPMKWEGVIQALFVVSIKDALMVSPSQQFLEWSAWCLSLAVEQNRLFNAVDKRNRELESIKQIGSALASSTFDIKQVLNYTMEMIRVIMNVEAGTLYLVQSDTLEFAVDFRQKGSQPRALQLKLGQGMAGYVAARGETMMVNEYQDNFLFLPEISGHEDSTIRSALCVPMISQGRVIGVIEVLNKISGDFGSSDADLVQSIASSVSIAIENANLYKETVAMAENERGMRRIFQKFVPKQVLDKILHGTASGIEMVEELKTLTLINLDIRDFSSLSKQLGPQKTVALLNAFFSLMGGIVFKHHGIVDKYLGDGFLAIFGAPVSSVSDADNAVIAALEMQSALETVNNGLAGEMGVALQIGISIHTGEVVVGNIGFDMKMDYTVIGDSVNDVFRLQDKVRPFPNSILVSEKTLRAVRLSLETVELDERLGNNRIYKLLGGGGQSNPQ